MRSDSSLNFKVYRKATHSNSYLHYFSFHSHSIKFCVAQGLFLRALRIHSPDFLEDEIKFIFSSFTKLAYPYSVLNRALSKAKSTHNRSIQRPKFQGSTFCFPFVPSLDSVMHSRILVFLHLLIPD